MGSYSALRIFEIRVKGRRLVRTNQFVEAQWAVPRFVGGKGTPAERREALRAAYRAQNAKEKLEEGIGQL